jgi:predicted nucleic acid-binding protein
VGRFSSRLDRWFGHGASDLLLEEHPTFLPRIAPFFEAAERGEFRLVTSLVTLIEVLVHPLREGQRELAQQYRDVLLESANLTAVPLDERIAEQAAELRARHKLRTPDAIQVATALHSGAAWFFTSDAGLPEIPGISTLVLKRLP